MDDTPADIHCLSVGSSVGVNTFLILVLQSPSAAVLQGQLGYGISFHAHSHALSAGSSFIHARSLSRGVNGQSREQ